MFEATQQIQAAFPATTFWIPLSLEKYRGSIEQAIATSDRIAQAALELLQHPEQRQAMQADYQVMRQALGTEGVCDRAAREILQLAQVSNVLAT